MKHENGFLKTRNNLIVNDAANAILQGDICIVVDVSIGTLHRVGSRKDMEEYIANNSNNHIRADLKLVDFKKDFDYIFTVDEICTVINWFDCHIGSTAMKQFLEMSPKDMRKKLKELKKKGY